MSRNKHHTLYYYRRPYGSLRAAAINRMDRRVPLGPERLRGVKERCQQLLPPSWLSRRNPEAEWHRGGRVWWFLMPNRPHKAAAEHSPGLGMERGLHLLFLASSPLAGLSRWPVLNSGGPTHQKGTAGHRWGWTEMSLDGVASLLCGAQPHPAGGHVLCTGTFGVPGRVWHLAAHLDDFRVVEHILMIFRVEHPRAGCAGLSKLLCGVFRGAGPRPGGVPSGPTRAEPGRAVHCHDNPAQK